MKDFQIVPLTLFVLSVKFMLFFLSSKTATDKILICGKKKYISLYIWFFPYALFLLYLYGML